MFLLIKVLVKCYYIVLNFINQCYGRSVELQPNSGHLKYLYLGQLLDGTEAADCYRKAIEIMLNYIECQVSGSSHYAVL